jgi:hypothetical protein
MVLPLVSKIRPYVKPLVILSTAFDVAWHTSAFHCWLWGSPNAALSVENSILIVMGLSPLTPAVKLGVVG